MSWQPRRNGDGNRLCDRFGGGTPARSYFARSSYSFIHLLKKLRRTTSSPRHLESTFVLSFGGKREREWENSLGYPEKNLTSKGTYLLEMFYSNLFLNFIHVTF